MPPASPSAGSRSLPPLHVILPLKEWWGDRSWLRGWLTVFLVFAGVPFVIEWTASDATNLSSVAWAYGLYFALAWLVVFYAFTRPQGARSWVTPRVAVFGGTAAIAVALLLENVLHADKGSGFFHFTFTVGYPEEAGKALPVLLLVYLWRRPVTAKTFMFYGAVSGLGFGVAEAVTYSLKYAEALAVIGPAASTRFTSMLLARLLTDSLAHAVWGAIAAYFIGLATIYRRGAVALIVFGVSLSAVLHGAFDTFGGPVNWKGFAVAIASLLVLSGYMKNGGRIEDTLEGMGEVGAARVGKRWLRVLLVAAETVLVLGGVGVVATLLNNEQQQVIQLIVGDYQPVSDTFVPSSTGDAPGSSGPSDGSSGSSSGTSASTGSSGSSSGTSASTGSSGSSSGTAPSGSSSGTSGYSSGSGTSSGTSGYSSGSSSGTGGYSSGSGYSSGPSGGSSSSRGSSAGGYSSGPASSGSPGNSSGYGSAGTSGSSGSTGG